MRGRIVITGIGMVTPLGQEPATVLRRALAGESAAAPPTHFDASPYACRVCAEVKDFDVRPCVPEPKLARLMNRDAQFAVAAAHAALADAQLRPGEFYAPEDIALFGATGLAGLPLNEVAPLVQRSVTPAGAFDVQRFGAEGLKAISPLLSFKVLGNMPVCFVSICENIQGPNCIYTPWESAGVQAIDAGMRAIEGGDARCALVGGCDVKTHELAFLSLEQQGFFCSWKASATGVVPGEGAVFLVLESEDAARARQARIYARLVGTRYRRELESGNPADAEGGNEIQSLSAFLSSRDDELPGPEGVAVLYPKRTVGNLFAAAAPLQVGLAALLAAQGGDRIGADCLWNERHNALFFLDPA